jgi:hypothetical protein
MGGESLETQRLAGRGSRGVGTMWYEDLLERLGLLREPVRCFEQVTQGESLLSRRDLGVMPVRVDRIVGTISRCKDITAEFHPRDEIRFNMGALRRRRDLGSRLRRLGGIRQAVERGEVMPPIELYRLRDEYYVVDGHHRVAVAKEMDAVYIDAHVIDFLPPADTPVDVLGHARSNFEVRTGLHQIELTDPSGYDVLIAHIEEHRRGLTEVHGRTVSLREAAEDWRREVYVPIAMGIERELAESAASQEFSGKTVGDLYLLLVEYKWLESERQEKDIGLHQAMLDLRLATDSRSWLRDIVEAVVPCRLLRTCPLAEHMEDVATEA